jgi:hypothetical protein
MTRTLRFSRRPRPESTRDGVANDRHRLSTGDIAVAEVTPRNQRNAKRREIAGVDDVPRWIERFALRGHPGSCDTAKADSFEAARRNTSEHRGRYIRQLTNAAEHVPPERQPGGVGVSSH